MISQVEGFIAKILKEKGIKERYILRPIGSGHAKGVEVRLPV